ncbi:2-dehydropantoate 2-reductase (Ketopantoate reductase) (KPA reductase) (KPR) [Coemansia brasiliensis]|uniref:2-dehydropantoate 2-reductase n=1 Tax=Coemansia brasiliensis TaxID=2650707 RepID=A0A9W8LY51_9FUNG|nr:2-dehydropantoate 2-reductase (Ketopantoate reductase) (KPA reductase) (KPR) [Coemansia brasiliensis]
MASSAEGGRLSRIYVLGAGAVGLLFAGHLRNAGYPITLLLRSSAAVERFEQQGGKIGIVNDWIRAHPSRQRLLRAGEEIPCCSIDDVQAETPTEKDTIINQLIITTKAQHVQQAYSQVQSRLNPNSAVLMLQNGMGTLEAIQRKFYTHSQNQPAFIIGTNAHGCLRHSNEEFATHHTAMSSCKIALHIPSAPQSAMEMLTALAALPLNVSVVNWSDLQPQMLLKLAANAVINPATALAGCRNGLMLQPEVPSVREFVASACLEIAAIYARAHPHLHSELSAAAIEEYVLNIVHVTAQNKSSMLQDVAAARPTESDWINGYLVRLGQQHGVPTPINTSLYALMKLRESAF